MNVAYTVYDLLKKRLVRIDHCQQAAKMTIFTQKLPTETLQTWHLPCGFDFLGVFYDETGKIARIFVARAWSLGEKYANIN